MSFWEELKRRNVYKVGAAYLGGAWLATQVVDIVVQIFEAPLWIGRTVFDQHEMKRSGPEAAPASVSWSDVRSGIQEAPELAAAARVLQLPERLGLDLADALAGDGELLADLF